MDNRFMDIMSPEVEIRNLQEENSRLRALVEAGCRCSPIPDLVERATPLALRIDVDAG